MICTFILTLTIQISGPTKNNNQGILKVEQYQFVEYLNANSEAKFNLLVLGSDLNNKTYPKIVGVDLLKTQPFECEYEGRKL